MAATWTEWLRNTEKGDVYFLLNTLISGDPLNRFYANDWIEEALPLYAGTRLSHLSSVGPLIIKIKWQALSAMAKILETEPFSDNSWGWAYHSTDSWDHQIKHWQKYQFVMFEGEERIFRLFDSRVAQVIIPACKPADWSYLLMPVTDCFISTSQDNVIITRPGPAEPKTSSVRFVLGAHLCRAWEQSPQCRVNMADNFYIQFWDEFPELALTLDEPEGRLMTLINHCMDEYQADLVHIAYLNNDMFIRYLKKNNLTDDKSGITDAS